MSNGGAFNPRACGCIVEVEVEVEVEPNTRQVSSSALIEAHDAWCVDAGVKDPGHWKLVTARLTAGGARAKRTHGGPSMGRDRLRRRLVGALSWTERDGCDRSPG
jgi:hypothetical protein